MAKKIKYSATFPDGVTVTRSSHRTYTHAWRMTYKRVEVKGDKSWHREWNAEVAKGTIYSNGGFSGSEALARSAARVGDGYAIVDTFVVPVTVEE